MVAFDTHAAAVKALTGGGASEEIAVAGGRCRPGRPLVERGEVWITGEESVNVEVIGASVAVVGALLWIRRDMRHDIAELRRDMGVRIDGVQRDLSAQIAAVNTRIDNILLADRPKP